LLGVAAYRSAGGVRRYFRRRRAFSAACVSPNFFSALPLLAGIKNWALVTASGDKLQEVSLPELDKFCKGTRRTWPDGRNFTLVMHGPESPEMRVPIQKLFGVAPSAMKPLIAKLNESRPFIRIVGSDEDLLRMVEATPGAVGLVDIYAINSAVKVLRIDGKLPFDSGYVLRDN
jgi:hypothetical protein